jgi:exodeoxyribonuclease V alpha subunit
MTSLIVDTGELFSEFCRAGLWIGLGQTTADRLAGAGIRSPSDVTATRLATVAGVSAARAGRLVTSFQQAAPVYDVAELLVPAGLPPRLAGAAVVALGPTAAVELSTNPWRLLGASECDPGQADAFARMRLGEQARLDDPRRGGALVGWLLRQAARRGHTMVSVAAIADGLSERRFGDPVAAVAAAISGGDVLAFPSEDAGPSSMAPTVGLLRYAAAEDGVAAGVARLQSSAAVLSEVDCDVGVELDETQRAAVQLMAEHGVSVLTGGPGTGKSRTVAAVVELARLCGATVALAAPTGRAARRLSELTGEPATTIHRLLGAQGRAGEFAHGEDWPLEADVVVIDEASMLDVELGCALMEAIPDGAHLLLVGDPAQLPSIGPGRLLADILESGSVPVTELRTLYRQAEGGAIARLALAVRAGELSQVDPADREVVVVPAEGSKRAAQRVVQLVTDSIPRALGIPSGEVQVVTPVHRGESGTISLNAALKAQLNPGPGAAAGFDIGDRVVATANHLDLGFANGEVGVVTDTAKDAVTVEFAGESVMVPRKHLSDLRHGWAITVHRAQGSEWPAVVTVLGPEAGGMLTRPLVYTAFTRAQRHLSIVHAAGSALGRAVSKADAAPRQTRLRELLGDD